MAACWRWRWTPAWNTCSAPALPARKQDRRAGDVGVFVNVKPLKNGGAKNPLDPYYWRFVAFGTKAHAIKPKTASGLSFGGRVVRMVKHPGSKPRNFLEAGAAVLPAALDAIQRAGSDDADAVVKELEGKKVNDVFLRNGEIRAADHRVLHDAYLVKVKDKADVKEEWDYEEILKTIPAAEAFNPTVSTDCKM